MREPQSGRPAIQTQDIVAALYTRPWLLHERVMLVALTRALMVFCIAVRVRGSKQLQVGELVSLLASWRLRSLEALTATILNTTLVT